MFIHFRTPFTRHSVWRVYASFVWRVPVAGFPPAIFFIIRFAFPGAQGFALAYNLDNFLQTFAFTKEHKASFLRFHRNGQLSSGVTRRLSQTICSILIMF
jgi:hypothetical protein